MNYIQFLDEKHLIRFINKIQFTQYCWNWIGGCDMKGYGVIRLKKKQVKAYRLSYEWFVKDISKDFVIHHECENTRCVNPDHLIALTRQENTYKHYGSNNIMCPNGHFRYKNQVINIENKVICLACLKEKAKIRRGKAS